MRKIVVATFVFFFCLHQTTKSQTLNLIPNPDTTSIGFNDYEAIEYDGAIYTTYLNKFGKKQLAKYVNDTITLISNPDTSGSVEGGRYTIYNNTLWFRYISTNNYSTSQNDYVNRQYAKYDGSKITLIPNPPNTYCPVYTIDKQVFFIQHLGRLLCVFKDTLAVKQWGLYENNGSSFTKLAIPSFVTNIDFLSPNFLYNNKLCFTGGYQKGNKYIPVVYTYDGNKFEVSDTNNTNYTTIFRGFETEAFQFNSKVYFIGETSFSNNIVSGLSVYDGIKLSDVWIDTIQFRRFDANGLIYNNKLLLKRNELWILNDITELLEFDGLNVKLLVSKKDSFLLDRKISINSIYKSKYYFPIQKPNGKRYLANYNGSLISILPNIDTTSFGVGGIISAGNNIYFSYFPKSNSDTIELARYTDSGYLFYKRKDVGRFNTQWKLSYQNKLYFNYSKDYYPGKYQLAYLSDSGIQMTCNPAISITATNSQVCFGTKVTFTATATDTGKLATYQWKKNNVNVGTNQRIYIDSSLNQNDTIVCLVTADSCMGKPTATSNAIYIQSPVKRNWAYITNDSGYIKVLDLNNNSIVKSIKISSIAFGVAISPNKQLAVFTVDNGDKPVVLNTATNTIIGYLPMLSNNSFKAIFSKDGSKIYCAIDTILRVFSSSNLIQIDSAFFPEGMIAYDLLLNENGDKLYLSKLSKVFEINSSTLTKTKTLNLGTGSLNNYYFLASNKVNSRIYITSGMNTSADSGYLAIYDNINDTIIKKIKFTKENVFLKLIESKSKLFMGNFSLKKVYVLSTISNSIIDSINLNETPIGIDSSSDGNFIYVANGKYLTKINTTTHAIVQTITVPNTLYAYSIGNFILEQNDSCASSKVITGNFITPNKKVIKNVSLKLMGTQNNNTLASGNYSFTVTDGNYTLRPTKNNDITKANGVTSIDVLLTQRHILNATKLNSPYKIIAADVDGNKLVNSVDILRMKRLILGTDTTFTKTVGTVKTDRLWEFVDSAYTFPDTTNPFPFKDSISFTNLTSNKTNQTFIGVKLGDVNYDWNPTVARGIAVNSLELIVNSEKTTNNNLQLSFISSNFSNLAALQTTLHFDNANYEFIGIENGKLQLDYNASKANKTGNIAILWTDKNAEAKSFDKDEVLFTVALKPRSLGIGNLELVVSNNMVETEAWDNNFTKRNIILSSKEIYNSPLATNHLLIYPNPAKGNVTIQTVGAKELLIIDYLGKIISKQSLKNNASILNIKLKPGVYIVQATMQDGSIRNEKVIVE